MKDILIWTSMNSKDLPCRSSKNGWTAKKWYTYGVHFEGGGRWSGVLRQKWDVIVLREWGLASVLEVQSLFLLQKIGFARWPDIMLNQTIYYWQEIFLLTLRSDRKPSFNDTITLFVDWIEQCSAWSIWMWRDLVLFLFWFHSFTCTIRLLFHSLFTFSCCANKTGWLQNEY